MLTLSAGCAGEQSALEPAGPAARAVATVWWWMFGYATVVLVAVVALWVYAQWRRPREWAAPEARRIERRWLIGGGLVLPFVSVALLLAFGIPTGRAMLPLPVAPGQEQPLRVEAIGQQWQWEIRYPEGGVQLVNELRLPVGRAVDVHTTSVDVIHSFWVPRLGGKIDAIPGRINVIRLQADEAGRFRGQCAEFCGLGHAHMTMTVHAMAREEFDAWLAAQAQGGPKAHDAPAPAAAPTGGPPASLPAGTPGTSPATPSR